MLAKIVVLLFPKKGQLRVKYRCTFFSNFPLIAMFRLLGEFGWRDKNSEDQPAHCCLLDFTAMLWASELH